MNDGVGTENNPSDFAQKSVSPPPKQDDAIETDYYDGGSLQTILWAPTLMGIGVMLVLLVMAINAGGPGGIVYFAWMMRVGMATTAWFGILAVINIAMWFFNRHRLKPASAYDKE